MLKSTLGKRTKPRRGFNQKLSAAIADIDSASLAELIAKEQKQNAKYLFFAGEKSPEWSEMRRCFRESVAQRNILLVDKLRMCGFPDSECREVLNAEIGRLQNVIDLLHYKAPWVHSSSARDVAKIKSMMAAGA